MQQQPKTLPKKTRTPSVPWGKMVATVAIFQINREHFPPVNILHQERMKIAIASGNQDVFHNETDKQSCFFKQSQILQIQ